MHKPSTVCLLMFFVLCLVNGLLTAQSHNVYLLSNLESLAPTAPEFDAFQKILEQDNNEFTILIAGDFVDENGLGVNPEQSDLDKVDRLLSIAGEKGKIIFVPGDREWDNGGKKGLKKVRALEKYLESKRGKGNVLYPQKGCLGPEVIDIGDHLRIVAVNTQWFLEDNKKPEEEDADCGLLNDTEFWFEIEDYLGDSENRNVVIAGHHPVLSYGQYAGYRLERQHFLPPVVGSFIAAYHQSVGGEKDLTQKNFQAYSSRMLQLTQRFPGGIFVSGHEYDNQVLYKDNTYHINSGAIAKAKKVGRGKETMYRQNKPGFAKLIFADNGEVAITIYDLSNRTVIRTAYEQVLFASPCDTTENEVPKNILFDPCEDIINNNTTTNVQRGFTTAIAGKEYSSRFFKKLILGKHYRSTWAQPIANIPYLDMDTTFGGLRPYAKGGGAQTVSVKFKSADGRTFAFRSVNKNPTQRMDKDLRPGIYGKVTQDKTSHQHPFSSTILGPLMDRLELPHAHPTLYVMPDDPRLGAFREEFAGMLGTLELKPKGKKKDRAGFMDADDVEKTMQMYKELIDDNDNKVDVDKFVKARLLDIWVADWDRHFNNYKWLVYENGKEKVYTPFPKDRDKSLSLYQGLYWFIEVFHIQKDKNNFRKNYYGLKYLNFKNKTMDRWLANSYTYEDWMKAVAEFQSVMTDDAIADAISHLPPETQGLVRERMTKVLKARREKMPKAIKRYYKMLAKQIDLIGSNAKELFELERLENGDVHARIYKTNKEGEKRKKIYDRVIKRSETDEIRLHGLGKDDHFIITGKSKKSILIRIIGGKGDDRITDESEVRGLRKMTRIYDKRGDDKLVLSKEAKKVETHEILNFKSDEFFHYNYLNVLPTASFNIDDGFGLGFTGTYTRQKFNKPDFGQQYNFSASLTTRKNYNINLTGRYRHLLGRWDGLLQFALASRDRTFRNFYGYSNTNEIDEDLRAENYYENESSSLNAQAGLMRTFWNKSSFSGSFVYDVKDVDFDQPAIYDELPREDGLGETALIGSQFDLNIDLRNSATFPTKGLQLTAEHFHYLSSKFDYEKGGGRFTTELSTFFTAGIKLPVTLSLRGGYINAYGDGPFYYKAYLGQQNNLRGFVRNRFGGDEAAYLNSDLRFHFGKIITPLVPIKYGIFGLFDTGRSWTAGADSEEWHYAYGGGIYVIPYVESFNLTFTGAQNEEGDFLFSFGIGFFVR